MPGIAVAYLCNFNIHLVTLSIRRAAWAYKEFRCDGRETQKDRLPELMVLLNGKIKNQYNTVRTPPASFRLISMQMLHLESAEDYVVVKQRGGSKDFTMPSPNLIGRALLEDALGASS